MFNSIKQKRWITIIIMISIEGFLIIHWKVIAKIMITFFINWLLSALIRIMINHNGNTEITFLIRKWNFSMIISEIAKDGYDERNFFYYQNSQWFNFKAWDLFCYALLNQITIYEVKDNNHKSHLRGSRE